MREQELMSGSDIDDATCTQPKRKDRQRGKHTDTRETESYRDKQGEREREKQRVR